MTSQGNGPPVLYVVRLSGMARDEVKARYQEAVASGRGWRFLSALVKINEQLRHQPVSFGDPLYRLPALRLQVFQCAIAPLVVQYGVHEELPLVFIRKVLLLS